METQEYDYDEFNGEWSDTVDHTAHMYSAIDWIKIVVPPIHLFFGICGNTIIVYIMWKSISVVTPLCAYAVVMAITDTLYLLVDDGSEWFALLAHKNLYSDVIGQSDTTCKAFQFLRHFLAHLTSWIAVSVAIESLRMTRDYRRLEKFKLQRVKDTLVLLIVLMSTLNMHYFWTYGIETVDVQILEEHTYKVSMCTFVDRRGYTDEQSKFVVDQLHWIVSDFMPIAVIIVLLGLITHAYYTCDQRKYQPVPLRDYRAENSAKTPRDPQRELVDRALWIVLVVFVVFKAPYVIAREANDYLLKDLTRDEIIEARWTVSLVILHTWRTTNFSGKVVLYTATWGSFREKLGKVSFAFLMRIRHSLCKQTEKLEGCKMELTEV